LSNISIVAISVGLPVAVNQQSRFSTIPCNLTLLCRRQQQAQWSWALQ